MSRQRSESAVSTRCPLAWLMSASRKREGTASLPLLSRFSCATPRNTGPPWLAGNRRPCYPGAASYPTFLHFFPLYWKGREMVKDDEAFSVFRTMTYEAKLRPDFNWNLALINP